MSEIFYSIWLSYPAAVQEQQKVSLQSIAKLKKNVKTKHSVKYIHRK